MEKDIERRKYKRVLIKDLLFTVSKLEKRNLGRIRDMSQGGMSFEDLPSTDQKDDDTQNMFIALIDVFDSKGEFSISNLKCRVVFDAPSNSNHSNFNIFYKTRRYGIEFYDLTAEQTRLIDKIMKDHSAETAPKKLSGT
jgi:c-di-GMP-binding flagellar brake protein YcgR